MVSNDELEELDKYALMKLDEVIAIARKGYDEYEYHTTAHALHNFCVVDMSNFYFDVLKDRLYTTAPDSKSRRAAQTVLYKVLDALTLILTPILAFTCDEIWTAMKHDKSRNPEGPLFNNIPTADYIETDEAKVTLYADGELADFLKSELKSLPEIFITSAVEIADGEGEFKGDVKGLSITVNKADGEKCERCWKFSDTVGQDSEHPTLCAHCAETMKQL